MLCPYIDLELKAGTAIEAKSATSAAINLTLGDSLRDGRLNLFIDSLDTAERLIAVLQVKAMELRAKEREALKVAA